MWWRKKRLPTFEKSRILAQVIQSENEQLTTFAEQFFEIHENQVRQAVSTELLVFELHVVDRLLYNRRIPDHERAEFMDGLIESVVGLQHVQEFRALYNSRTDEYARMPIQNKQTSEGRTTPKDTLYWEFAKRLATMTGHAMDAAFIVPFEHAMVRISVSLNVKVVAPLLK